MLLQKDCITPVVLAVHPTRSAAVPSVLVVLSPGPSSERHSPHLKQNKQRSQTVESLDANYEQKDVQWDSLISMSLFNDCECHTYST